MSRFSRLLVYLLSMACLLFGLSQQASARTESEIKAFYLFNFIKFVTWPDEPNELDINVCISGDNPFSALTEKMNSLSARGRQLRIVELGKLPPANCSLLFVSTSEANFYQDLLASLDVSPTLTVSDIEGFMGEGGMIGFIKIGNVVRFEINLKQARAAGLKLSSKLLELANRVEQ